MRAIFGRSFGSRHSESDSSARSSGVVCFSPSSQAAACTRRRLFFQRRSLATIPSARQASRIAISASIVSSVIFTLPTASRAWASISIDSETDGDGSGDVITDRNVCAWSR